MSERHDTLRTQLDRIETEMRQLGLWQPLPPPPAAFESELPFHADSMDFEHWLQWVMLARFRALADAQGPLPASCGITPMAEHLWQERLTERAGLLALLKELDELF